MATESRSPSFFASASRGAEEALAGELRGMGIAPVEPRRGGVAFGTRLEDGYRACLWSRIASRVLLPLTEFEAPDAEALYAGVREVAWTDHLGPERTLAVAVAGRDAAAGPPHFVALKTKDAIVDRIRDATGARPDVDKQRPDVRIHVHVRGSHVGVALDLAGRGLHHRGRARPGAAAPLRETLAAALLHIAGWPGRSTTTPLYDPLCGTGTLLVEAAAIACDVAPGLQRGGVGLERWRGHDAALWRRLTEEARGRAEAGRGVRTRIAGSDASSQALAGARRVLDSAGLAERVRLERRELSDARAPGADAGLVVTNPPYGARLGEAGELGWLYEQLGDVLKHGFPGWTAWILSGNPALTKRIGLRPQARHVVFNGPIECRWLEIPISAAPATRSDGPGWRKPGADSRGFATRLKRNVRRLTGWARQEGLTCYRLYDSDVPQFNLAVDWYDGAVRVEEYAPPKGVSAEVAERRLADAVRVAADVLEVDPADIVVRVRRRLEPGEQHPRYGDRGRFREVVEAGLRFRVNLDDYLDTGLFLDDRLLRRELRDRARGREFLNLFAYTCAASVAAAAGGARGTTSVDLSRTYLDWGRANFELNGLAGPRQRFVRADALQFASDRRRRDRYGLIFVAPPSRSVSKGMRGDFDVQRDHGPLLVSLADRLERDGTLLFATHRRDFELDLRRLDRLQAREITEAVTPTDFERRPRLRAWLLQPTPRSSPGEHGGPDRRHRGR